MFSESVSQFIIARYGYTLHSTAEDDFSKDLYRYAVCASNVIFKSRNDNFRIYFEDQITAVEPTALNLLLQRYILCVLQFIAVSMALTNIIQ